MTTTNAPELALELTRTIDAPKERVFDAWLDPAMLATFMTPMPGVTVPEAQTDPREGGRFLVVMRSGDQDMPHSGTYVTIDRPNRLAFTWESPFSEIEGSTVTLDFADAGTGTKITLRHVRFETEESRNNHEGGWSAILDTLAGAF